MCTINSTFDLEHVHPLQLHPYLRSPLRDLPGPMASVWNWIFGDMKILAKEFDHIAYKGYFNADRIHTTDAQALNYFLTRSEDFSKLDQSRRNLARTLRNGLLVVNGAFPSNHHRTLRLDLPIRELTSIFVDKSIILRDKWATTIAQSGSAARIDVLSGLNQMMLNVIGMTRFSYGIYALGVHGSQSELNRALQRPASSTAGQGFPFIVIAKTYFPILKFIPDRMSNRSSHVQAIMRRVGMQLLAKKAELLSDGGAKGGIERRDVVGCDLLTLLIKANMAADVPDNQRLTDEEVLGRSFFVADHDTTSTATTWYLFALAQHRSIQAKLHEKLLAVDTDAPMMNEHNALPYLDCVVRESLRMHAPVPRTERIAIRDIVVPLDTPFKDVLKGCIVNIPILAIHRSKTVWGEDALKFKPKRWERPPEAASSTPGVWSHLLTFLGGAHACIGYRFSLVGMKALLFVLVRAFEYKLAMPAEEIVPHQMIVQRPMLRGALHEGGQMPLLVSPYVHA
ncbi:cytochrome P450 [Trametes meyenii]|nr:cytochrome P450 [Trametes meyenii]